jgi:hypothetical protein
MCWELELSSTGAGLLALGMKPRRIGACYLSIRELHCRCLARWPQVAPPPFLALQELLCGSPQRKRTWRSVAVLAHSRLQLPYPENLAKSARKRTSIWSFQCSEGRKACPQPSPVCYTYVYSEAHFGRIYYSMKCADLIAWQVKSWDLF